MSVQLQVAIPLFVTFAALAGIAVWRKYFKLETLILGIAALSLGVYMTVWHTNVTKQMDSELGSISDSAEVSLMLADQYMLESRFDEAADVLLDLQKSNAGDSRVLVASARCAVLRGNYAVAVQLYQQAGMDGEELQQAVLLMGTSQLGNGSTVQYLKDQGIDPAVYGLSAADSSKVDRDEAVKKVRKKIANDLEDLEEDHGSDIMEAVRYAAKLTAGFGDYVSGVPDVKVKSSVNKLEKCIEAVPSLAKNAHIRIARLKGYVLTGAYRKMAIVADRNVTAEELVVLTQLLVDGAIDEDDFTSSYVNMDGDRYREVLEACRKALSLHESELSRSRLESYENKLDLLKEQMKAPALFVLRQDLLKEAADGAADMRSKSYLALAKLENKEGNKKLAEKYISQAIGTAGDSNDQNYSIPMNQMASIIQGTAATDEIKNVAQYVDAALDHSLPLDVTVSEVTGKEENSLQDQMTTTVTQSTATINIGVINKDNFPVVKARVQIESTQFDTLEELREHLLVYDCGSQITDFTLEKLEYQKSRIILLCDVSGSMSGNVSALKNAIISFAENMQPGEEVSVIGFDDRIEFVHNFSGDPEEVKSFANSIYASGGTALFNAVIQCGNYFTYDINSNNVIIAMTDGQDGSPAREGDMHNKIGAMVADKDLTLYTMGLGGGVNIDYLKLMAECGNGSYLYVQNQEDLEEFYDFIHGQLANQYILTYTAKNKTLNQRKLEVSVDGELGGAEKTYYLVDPEYSNEGSDSYNPYTVEDTDISVNGLTTKFLYKSSQGQTVNLRGAGFDSGDDVTIRLIGNVKYDLDAKWIDSSTYQITIPAEVATGVYDLTISVRGKSITLEDELTIAVSGDMKNFRFGSYSFTALKSYINDNGDTVLSGNVIMNGWLYFKGDITVRKDYSDSSKAWITDNSGIYVSYSDALAKGLAQTLADEGIPVSFSKLGTFCIYDHKYTPEEYEDFPVEKIDFPEVINVAFLIMDNFGVSIYPDMLRVQGMSLQYKLPFQEQLMRNLKIGGTESVDFDSDAIFSATQIALIASVEYSGEELQFTMVSLPLTLSEAKVEIDTLKNDYAIEAEVKFKAIGDMDSMKFSFGVKNGRFDSIGLQTGGTECSIMTTPVPISMADFGFELKDFSQFEPDDNLLSKILATDIVIKFNVNVASLNKYLPDIAKLIDDKDVTLAQLKDCELSLKLKEFRLSFDADVTLCTILDIGKVKINMGKFSYTNALIGYYDETQYGLQAALTVGTDWKSSNLEMGLDGTAELTIGYPYTGLWLNGNVDFDIGWWILSAELDLSGDVLLGGYINSSDNLQFSIIVRGTNTAGKHAGFHLYVTRVTGFDIYTF